MLATKMTRSEHDHIGFLNVPTSFKFSGGLLLLSKEFDQAKRWMERYANKDGFLYPPLSRTARLNPQTGKATTIPRTKRPALLHRVPNSHELILEGVKDIQKARSSLAGFVMLCFSYLYGTRLQFFDWWVDGRVPLKSTINVRVTQSAAEAFLSKAIHTWRQLDRRRKRVASNALYVYSKAGSAEWDWERFQLEYIVSDACYSIAEAKDGCRANGHGKRFKALCSTYGLKYNSQLIRLFVKLRNNLFHEALWDGGQPNTARSGNSFMASHHLRRFNHKLIASIFAGQSKYTKSAWWFIDPDDFTV